MPGGALRYDEARARRLASGPSHLRGRRSNRRRNRRWPGVALGLSESFSNAVEVIVMPSTQRGQAYKLGSGKWGLRYYDARGSPTAQIAFSEQERCVGSLPGPDRASASRRAAVKAGSDLQRNSLSFTLIGTRRCAAEDDRHADGASTARAAAVWDPHPPRARAHGRRDRRLAGQAASRHPLRARPSAPTGLEAAVRWGYMGTNPAKLAGRNRQPAPRPCACSRSLSWTL